MDNVEKYMMEKGWTGRKNLDRMELKKEIYKWVLDGIDWDEYENGFSEEWDVAIGMKVGFGGGRLE